MFENLKVLKQPFFAILGPLIYQLGRFQPSKIAKIHKKPKIRASKFVQVVDFVLLESPKIDFP